MKKLLKLCLLIMLLHSTFAAMSQGSLSSLPRGGNKRASVSEQIGITDVTIHYSRPGVKGRDGHIWGELIQPGFYQLGYGFKKPAPWRAGANENTTIEFSTDVKIEGQDLPADMAFLLLTVQRNVPSSSRKIQLHGVISFMTLPKMHYALQ